MSNKYDKYKKKKFWKEIVPALSISGNENKVIPESKCFDLELNRSTLVAEGYQEFPEVLSNKEVTKLRNGIIALHKNQMLPVFCMLFDEYWQCVAKFQKLLVNVLGGEALMLPDFWAWHVDPKKSESGWGPHRDKLSNTLTHEGMPKSLTMWIALSDATPKNGCMYMVPADQDPYYLSFDTKDVPTDMQSVRALPAKAGTAFIWNQRVFHWGGKSQKTSVSPRISIAFEFQRGDIAPYNEPLLPLQLFPDFETRLRLVGKQILQYRHMYGFSDELTSLAQSFFKA